MELGGEYRITAPRAAVWAALNDATVLARAIPGCDSLEPCGDDSFEAVVTARVGPVKARFKGRVRLTDKVPPESYSINGKGQGGVAGFASGGADVTLTEDDGVTLLGYRVRAEVGGKLAQLGGRLIDATAKKMADDFFREFAAIVAPPEAPPTTAEAAPAEEKALPPIVWVPALLTVVAGLLYFFGIRP